MADVDYFVVAESASIDRDTNSLSIFNIIEKLTRPAEPENQDHGEESNLSGVRFNRMVAVACFVRQEDDEVDHQAKITISGPGIEEQEGRLNFQMENPRHRIRFRFDGVPDVEEGELLFELSLNGELRDEYRITVEESGE